MSFLFSKRSHTNPDEPIIAGAGIFGSPAGATISENKVLGITAAWAGTRVISESVSMLPYWVFRRVENGKERAPEHPVTRLLGVQSNPETTAMAFWDSIVGQAALRGNGYANIERNNSGNVVALWQLRTDRMRIERENGTLFYIYQTTEDEIVFRHTDILHIKGFGKDGFSGLDPLNVHRNGFGATIATDEQTSRFFSNDSTPGGIITHPGKLGNESRENMAKSWDEAHRGSKKKNRVAILEEGVTWQQVGLDPEKSQMLQTREFNVTEIARIFRIPPHMLADLSRATFSNVEQQGQDFLTYSLMPWLVRIEQEANIKLFTRNEQDTFFSEHQVQGLLRADAATRANFYNTGINGGWLSPDEVRSMENLNPEPDGIGNVYQRPLNAIFVGPGQESVPDPEETPPSDDNNGRSVERRSTKREQRTANTRLALQLAQLSAFENVLKEIITRERADILKIAKKTLNERNRMDFKRELSTFYEGHKGFIRRKLRPQVRSLSESTHVATSAELGNDANFDDSMDKFVDGYMDTYEKRHTKSGQRQIEAILDDSTPEESVENIEQRLDEWQENRHEKIARREVVQIGNAAAHATFLAFGLTSWRWVTTGAEDCPICESLDGRTVNAGGLFFSKGDQVKGAGVEPVKVRTDMAHPPLHQGCDCQLVPS